MKFCRNIYMFLANEKEGMDVVLRRVWHQWLNKKRRRPEEEDNMSNTDPIILEDFGTNGYKVLVKKDYYNFDAYQKSEGFIFEASNEPQTEELIQVLELVLEKIKNERLKKELLRETEKRYQKKENFTSYSSDKNKDHTASDI